ncbi:MAG: hypothetical protein GFH27_549279n210 [Chloroflexi bacterium AL-W]|nr:hypothetical protein [Chloroflexi bacterium AL-N1]NOK65176.1 hypothetical protein [Chloroflexi bacterium AL-N10]NOK72558.1 hypothetical protein [Chloroflexi bacterium AL-N5]NOK79355.1 hypothetical protein [Chloroflexi bacterium AL-W]NOK87271.1 hypothetical protein [Chloroflexi bacterium AL-N15]
MKYCYQFIVVLLTIMLFSACLPQTPELQVPPVGETDGARLPQDTPDSRDIVAEDSITITFGASEYQEPLFAPYIQQFNAENPDVQVQFVSLDDISIDIDLPVAERIAQWARATSRIADTAQPLWVGSWSEQAPYLQDLRPFIEADATFDTTVFYPGSLEAAQVDGGTYVLPHTQFAPLLSYNVDLLTTQGLSEPSPDWTWQEVRNLAEQVAQPDADPPIYGLLDYGDGRMALVGEMLAADPSLGELSPDRATIDTSAAETALTQVAAMAQTGALYIDTEEELFPRTYIDMIVAGQVAIWPTGLLADPIDRPTATVKTVPFPTDLPAPFASGVDGYVMSRGTEHPEAAWRWLSFLSNQWIEQHSEWDGSLSIPARQDLTSQSTVWQSLETETQALIETNLNDPSTASSAAVTLLRWLREPTRQVIVEDQAIPMTVQEAQEGLAADRLAEQNALDSDTDTDAAPIAVATPIPQTAPADATTITFASNVVNLQPIVEQFHREQTEVFVQLEAVNNPTLTDLANTTDCFVTWAPPTPAQREALRDLRPLWDADTTLSRDVFPAAVLAPFEHDGALYGLPHRMDIPILHYNSARFDAANLPYPPADWSLQDFVAAATQLTQERNDQYGFAVIGDHTKALEWWLQRAGVLQKTNAMAWTDPDVLAALQGYVDLLTSTSPHNQLAGYTRSTDPDLTTPLIAEGQVAMWLESGITFGAPDAAAVEAAVAPLPGGTADNRADDVVVTTGLYIAADTPHTDACWQWLRYLSADTTSLGGGFPARTDVASPASETQPAGQAEIDTIYQEALAQPTQGEGQTFFLRDPDLDPFWFYQALDRALQGASLEQELTNAQQLTEAHLACVDAGGIGSECAVATDPDYDGWQRRALDEEATP